MSATSAEGVAEVAGPAFTPIEAGAAILLGLLALLISRLMGLLLALLYQRTGSLIPGIIAHGMNNALAFMALYYFGMQ